MSDNKPACRILNIRNMNRDSIPGKTAAWVFKTHVSDHQDRLLGSYEADYPIIGTDQEPRRGFYSDYDKAKRDHEHAARLYFPRGFQFDVLDVGY